MYESDRVIEMLGSVDDLKESISLERNATALPESHPSRLHSLENLASSQ